MKHSYQPACTCDRCTRERNRRTAQGTAERARHPQPPPRTRTKRTTTRRPIPGSQEWAETRGDDLGESFD
jgi:hypothetical protein